MLKVLIADDHEVVRRGVRGLLADELGDVEVGEAGDLPTTLTRAQSDEWDLLILDVSMPGGSVIDTVEAIRAHRPTLPILVVSIHEAGDLAVRLLRAGVDGYLPKGESGDQLLDAVKRVLAGRKYIGPELAERLAMQLDGRSEGPLHERLSTREFQVLCGLGAGRSVSEIAEALGLSVKTVSTYRARLLVKMEMTSNAQLIRYAVEHDLGT